MGLLDWFKSRWESESTMYKYAVIPSANVITEAGAAAEH